MRVLLASGRVSGEIFVEVSGTDANKVAGLVESYRHDSGLYAMGIDSPEICSENGRSAVRVEFQCRPLEFKQLYDLLINLSRENHSL